MSGNPAHPASASMSDATSQARVCLLLACFRGARTAARARRTLGRQLTGGGDSVLDEVILRVDSRHRARVYDPRRVIAGTLTSALTWGVFGLITGGVASGGAWAIIGAVCGGLFAFYAEHVLTKDELKRIGRRLPGDSSAIAAFVAAGDGRRVLASAAPCQPAQASVAAIGADLSAEVLTETGPAGSPPAPPGGARPDRDGTALSMLLLRYRGDETARREQARHRPARGKDGRDVQTELIFEAPGRGRLKVSDPKQGTWAFAKSDLISWGLFGVIYGLIVGLVSNHGAFSAITDTAAAGIVCAAFGLAAGALYGLWAGRAVSARRLRSVRPLLPPGTSTVLAWSEADLTEQILDDWSEPGSQRLIVRFNPAGDGVLLEA
jgi:membrane associated rhomboid family serine protease